MKSFSDVVNSITIKAAISPDRAPCKPVIAVTTPGFMVSRFCGSGLDAVNTAAAKVMSGQADLIIAGGVEMLSLFSIFGSGGPMVSDVSFKDANVQIPQGLSADLIATLHGYSRNDVDALGASIPTAAADAWAKGFFNDSVPPAHDENGDPILARDELLRDNVTAESLESYRRLLSGSGKNIETISGCDIRGSPEFVTFIMPEILPELRTAPPSS